MLLPMCTLLFEPFHPHSIEARGRLFIKPGQDIYEGQVIGIHQRAGDLAVNACKRKAATNIRR